MAAEGTVGASAPPAAAPDRQAAGAPAIDCSDVSVLFGEFRALDGVAASFEAGAIHAIVGQNGAGKTTFSRVLAGLIQPDSGSVRVHGETLRGEGVGEARASGVELVHQHFALPPSFTVAEALELFQTAPRRTPFYRRRQIESEWAEPLESLGVTLDPGTRIRDLPVETLQSLEIARALVSDAKVLILDEPTAVLSPPAAEALFERLRRLRDDGVTILLILHKLREVSAAADTVTVLRGGKVVLPRSPLSGVSHDELSNLIVGSTSVEADTVALPEPPAAEIDIAPGAHTLVVRGLSTDAAEGDVALEDVSLTVRAGEIVGIAGVEGNGQRPLVAAIAGMLHGKAGTIELDGRDVTSCSALERRALGVRAVPFDRNIEGVSSTSAIWENVAILTALKQRSRWINPRRLKAQCVEELERWQVSYRDVTEPVGSLSGGNVQRVILARELSEGIRILLAAQPTRGLDVGATRFVRENLRGLAQQQAGVLLVSSDLEELFELSDRLLVCCGGRIVAEFSSPSYDLAAVGVAMTGGGQ
jgi:simple sugar transport system ATP-binding protein